MNSEPIPRTDTKSAANEDWLQSKSRASPLDISGLVISGFIVRTCVATKCGSGLGCFTSEALEANLNSKQSGECSFLSKKPGLLLNGQDTVETYMNKDEV